jgi:hypothetical protein
MIWQLKITYRWLWLQKRKNRNYEWLWNHCPQINSRLRVHRGGYSTLRISTKFRKENRKDIVILGEIRPKLVYL